MNDDDWVARNSSSTRRHEVCLGTIGKRTTRACSPGPRPEASATAAAAAWYDKRGRRDVSQSHSDDDGVRPTAVVCRLLVVQFSTFSDNKERLVAKQIENVKVLVLTQSEQASLLRSFSYSQQRVNGNYV